MLTKSANFKIDIDGTSRNVMVTPLFLQNHAEPWQPNEIYEILEITAESEEPANIGKLIIDDHMDWHYEGDKLSDAEVEEVAKFVLREI